MSAGSDDLVPGLSLTREQALALPGMRRYRLVEFLVRWEHFGAARELLESLVEQRTGRFFYQYRLAQCQLATGDIEQAKRLARELYAAPATRAIGSLAVGDVLYVEGRLARAEEQYREALEIEKTRESARRRLAWCMLHRRNVQEAAALADQLAAGRRPAQLPPAAVRLLAAIASAAGGAEEAGRLRRELKSRWNRELDRLRAALELAAADREPLFEEPPGLTPANNPEPADSQSGEAPEIQDSTSPQHPDTRTQEPSILHASNPQSAIRNPQSKAPSGYVYPTARERRAAAEARAEADRKTLSDRAPLPQPPIQNPKSKIQNPTLALKELFGYESFRPGQEEVVGHIMAGRSVLAMMPTGRGKSLCFQLPAMLLPRATVVISPLIALMQDQLEGLPPAVRRRATVLNSSLESLQLEQRLREVAAGRCSLIYAAPERLRQRPFLHALRRVGVSLLVVDEAHCISLWGQDFRPDYLFLPRVLEELGRPPLLAMTATATPAMAEDIRGQFAVPLETVSQGVFRPNLSLEVRRCPDRSNRLKTLIELCREEAGPIIVYVNARERAKNLSQALEEAGVTAGFYHAGLTAEQRETTQQRFMRDELRCLVATVAFGMGVDKADIRLIVHHDSPRSLEGYYQEAGRAGRDGRPARCILLASPGDRAGMSRWAKQERLGPDQVLRVHQELVKSNGCLTLSPDDLERETGLDDTQVRVAISVLERAGAVCRQYDLPRVCTLEARTEGDAAFSQFVAAARLRPRQRLTRDTEDLCAHTGIPPDVIELQLLDWVEEGWLEYRGSARGLRLESQAVPELEARVRELLQRMEAVDEARLSQLDDYVHTMTCRHAFISSYFGHRLRPGSSEDRCGVCDNCRREGRL